jgi:hypothetical protein
MIAIDLRRMSNPLLCKAAVSWSWAMQSRIIPGKVALP